MIPVNFLRKMGAYSLNLNGVTVEAKVVDNEELMKEGITELRDKLDPIFPIVGLDWKCTTGSVGVVPSSSPKPKLLVLYVKDRCLLVQLERMSAYRDSLFSFLSDERICFLSLEDPQQLRFLTLPGGVFLDYPVLKTGVDLGTFAAKALKNHDLKDCSNLLELATKSGFPALEQASEAAASQCPVPDWGAICFKQEEVKYAIKDAYDYYNLGIKLTSVLH